MKRSLGSLFAMLVAAGLSGMVGCGPPTPEIAPAGDDGPSSQTADGSYQAGDLSVAIGDYMPPLDGGSLEIASPQDWDWARPGGDYLVGFVPHGAELNNLPRILVSSEESPYPNIQQVSQDNVQAFATAVADSLADQEIANPPRPLILGDHVFVCYVTLAKRKNAIVSRQILETVVAGRRYGVRLEVYERQNAKYRDAAYAAAMSMKFTAETDPPPLTEDHPADPAPTAESAE